MKKVIVIGAGFVGQGVVKKLSKDPAFQITIINDHAHLSYKPLYPDVAGGRLDAAVIEYPLERFAAQHKVAHLVGSVAQIDFSRNAVRVNDVDLTYDYCVIAPGVKTNYYGREEFRAVTHVFDSVDDCRGLTNKIESLLAAKKDIIRVAVIGGGYTGVEYVSHCVRRFKICSVQAEITIVEIAQEILGPLSEKVKKQVNDYLGARKVRVKTGAHIETITENAVQLKDELIQADIVVWTAGMCGVDLCATFDMPQERGRITVDESMRPRGSSNVFVAGDAASTYRMAVPYAKQYAEQVVQNIRALDQGRELQPFQPKEYGYVVGLAEGHGPGEIMGFPMKGWYGFLFHYFMCFLTLPGIKNKLKLIASFFTLK